MPELSPRTVDGPVTWASLLQPGFADDRWFAVLRWVIPSGLAVAWAVAPSPTLLALALIALCALLWRSPNAIVLVLVALMGNAKIHYYTGSLTIFPEYPLILLATGIWMLQWMEGRDRPHERGLMLAFLWLVFAGVVSCIHAIQIPRVFSKGSVVVLTMLVFALTLRGVHTRREMGRALLWLEWAGAVVAGYAVLQITGALFGLDTSLTYFEKHGNPDFYYGIGPPVIHQFTKIFRANSFFNDSNILGGYIAAVVPVVFALRLHHGRTGRRLRAGLETGLLVLMGLALLFTLSRSGALALACGVLVVLVAMRRTVHWPSFMVGALVVTLGTALLSSALGFNPLVLFARLGASLDMGDYSNRTHYSVAAYAVDLFLGHPITGVGLRNFGFYYASQVDPYFPNMIAHNAFLGYFAETGLIGGFAFLTLILMIFFRVWRTVSDPRLAEDPVIQAWCVGLFAALVALTVSNVFYDFYLRTFTWVLNGLAVAAARMGERFLDERGRDRGQPA